MRDLVEPSSVFEAVANETRLHGAVSQQQGYKERADAASDSNRRAFGSRPVSFAKRPLPPGKSDSIHLSSDGGFVRNIEGSDQLRQRPIWVISDSETPNGGVGEVRGVVKPSMPRAHDFCASVRCGSKNGGSVPQCCSPELTDRATAVGNPSWMQHTSSTVGQGLKFD